MSASRRLAAILAADVVGFSRLMAADEEGTLTRLKLMQAGVIEPQVAAFNGRIFKTSGDGFLVEFASVVNAVSCAAAIQALMAEQAESATATDAIHLRIGVHLGDVIVEGSDLFGDGVNIAARLEALAPAGGILVSAMVKDNIGGRVDLDLIDQGKQQLKNIPSPIHVFQVTPRGSETSPAPLAPPSEKPGIAVLPFTNMSGDAEQEYFVDGITEDIITELARYTVLTVIARNSSFQYRGKSVDVREVSRTLGVRYVVEGSVRKLGNRVRITVQLIDAKDGSHIWSEKFDRSLEHLFDVQDEVTRTIVATTVGRVEDSEVRSKQRTISISAFDCYLRGLRHIRGYAPEDNRLAREYFQRAIDLDPDFGLAHAYLGLSLLAEGGYDDTPEEMKRQALEHALRSVQLDPREARCHLFLGQVYSHMDETEKAISHMEQSVRLNPNDDTSVAGLGSLLSRAGRPQEGVELIQRAMQINPFHPRWFWGTLAMGLFFSGRYQEALQANARLDRDKKLPHFIRDAAILAELGRTDEARKVATEILKQQPNFRASAFASRFRLPANAELVRSALINAGLPD